MCERHDWAKREFGAICVKCAKFYSWAYLLRCRQIFGPEWVSPVPIDRNIELRESRDTVERSPRVQHLIDQSTIAREDLRWRAKHERDVREAQERYRQRRAEQEQARIDHELMERERQREVDRFRDGLIARREEIINGAHIRQQRAEQERQRRELELLAAKERERQQQLDRDRREQLRLAREAKKAEQGEREREAEEQRKQEELRELRIAAGLRREKRRSIARERLAPILEHEGRMQGNMIRMASDYANRLIREALELAEFCEEPKELYIWNSAADRNIRSDKWPHPSKPMHISRFIQ